MCYSFLSVVLKLILGLVYDFCKNLVCFLLAVMNLGLLWMIAYEFEIAISLGGAASLNSGKETRAWSPSFTEEDYSFTLASDELLLREDG